MIKSIVKVLFLILIIVSCKVGPNYQRPDIKSPDQFRFAEGTQDSTINLKWWELFQNDELRNMIETALKNNQDVLIAAARIEEARAVVGYNKSDQYPQFNYEGNFAETNLQGYSVTDAGYGLFIGPSLSWELDFWGKYRRATEAARAELLASEYGQRAVQVGLISDVASTYFLLLDYDSRLDISQKTLETRKQYLQIIQERFDKGIVPEIDLNQAQIQVAIAAASVPFYERQVAQTENALNILLGHNPASIVRTHRLQNEPLPPNIPSGLPSSLLERRPDIRQAEESLAAQTAQIGVAQALRFPSFSLTGFLGAATTDLTSMTASNTIAWSAGAGLFGPLFNFGKNKRRVEIERQRMIQDSLSYAKTVLQAFREVQDALIEVSTYKRERAARQQQMVAAVHAMELSQSRYDGGVTSYLEVLDSERSKFDAELSASQAYQLELNAFVKFYKALGGGWITEEEMKNANQ